jgi:ribosomal protein S12 methylthiotransferase
LGCFAYSQEDATTAFDLGDGITAKEKQRRVKELMSVQEEISLLKNRELIGQVMPVVIDRIEDGVAYGRTEFDCPEVDNEVCIQSAENGFIPSDLKVGELYPVEITDAEAFDLFGEFTAR